MHRALLIAAFTFIVSMLGLCAGALAADQCDALQAKFRSAEASGQVDVMEAMLPDLKAECADTKIRFCAGNSVALKFADLARADAESGVPLEAAKATLLRGHKHGSPWQVLFMLGDVTLQQAIDAKDGDLFGEAGSYLQQTLNAINEPTECDGNDVVPSDPQIARLYRQMNVAQALATEFTVERTREGGCGGLFLQNIRGFTPTARPVPISFVFDKDEFTPAGEKAASAMLACLKEQGRSQIVLTGHTDSKGDEAYNLELSKRRLDRVATYLKASGVASELVLIPKGESEPFELDDPTRYTEEQIDQFNRRVVLVEGSN